MRAAHRSLSFIPDSGTDALRGISGMMTITIENGKNYYELAYALSSVV